LGGDEFAILMNEAATIENAAALAQRVLAAFSEPYAYEGQSIAISTSPAGAFGMARQRVRSA
jgi:GGDEF domain-containing protein